MKVKNKIKSIAADKGIKMSILAESLGMSPQVWAVKLSRGIVKIEDLEQILAALDCEIVIVDKKTRKVY